MLLNNEKFSFYSNLVSGDGGAIDAKSLTVQGISKLCVFQENTAQADGGACQVVTSFSAMANEAPIAFVANVAGVRGGGIAAVQDGQQGVSSSTSTEDPVVSFSRNTAVEFDGNVARVGGGIYSYGNVAFLNNGKPCFSTMLLLLFTLLLSNQQVDRLLIRVIITEMEELSSVRMVRKQDPITLDQFPLMERE